MKQRSPTIEGFRLLFSRPSLGLAEISWRWSFGAVALLSLAFLLVEYFRTLPISSADVFLLRTRHPLLISQAVAHIFRGSAGRLMGAGLVLFVLLSAAWILLASWVRSATVSALLTYFREDGDIVETSSTRRGSAVGLNFLRICALVSAVVACAGAVVLGQSASPPKHPSPGMAMLVIFTLLTGISLAWALLNWILSLASIFAVADGSGTFKAISDSIGLWRDRWKSIMAAGTWFGIAHATIFFMATSVVAFPLAFAGIMPPGIVIGGILLITLAYFAAADFLYAGKMAAYVAIAKPPRQLVLPPQSASVDRSEKILSDIGEPW